MFIITALNTSNDINNNKLLLIDGNSIMNRAFYGIPYLTNSEGLHTNAVYGFLNIMLKTIEEENASHIIVAFDLKVPTFRHEMFKDYKGNRKGMPDELREQMPIIKDVLGKMNINICQIEGYEADDILGTLAVKGESLGFNVTILSGDKDLLQLATKKIKISIPKTKNGKTNIEEYFEDDVIKVYNVTPIEFIDVKALMGDSSDNIPGVPGIGIKTAIKIINEYHSIENAYENVDALPKRASNMLKENFHLAVLSKKLATICTNCKVNINIEDSKINNIYTQEAYKLFKKLEFKSLLERFEKDESYVNEIKSIDFTLVKDENQFINLFNQELTLYYYLIKDSNFYILTWTSTDKMVYYTDTNYISESIIKEQITINLNNKKKKIITHNLKEQLHYLETNMSIDNLTIMDLSLASYLLNPIKDSYELDDIANEILNKTFPSFEELLGKGKNKKSIMELSQEQRIEYFCHCCVILFESCNIIEEKLKNNNLLDLYYQIELPLLYVLKSMETLGIGVDSKALKNYSNKLQEKLSDIENNIYDLAEEKFNINSPKQLGVILFEKLGLPIIKKTKSGYSTAVGVLEKLKGKHPIIDYVMEYRQLSKLKSTYADGLFDYIQSDGRIHSTFKQQVTSTGRISSIEPNLQNIPIKLEIGKEIRKVFIPKKDYFFIDADYSQIELRILAHLSGDETFIEAFNNNIDIHRVTASQVFHVPFEQVSSIQRRNAKAVNFGIVYGISAFGLSRDLNISIEEASNYIKQYFEKYPKVKEFLDKSVNEAKINGFVKTMFNRIRHIPELNSNNFMQRSFGERIAMNTPIQGSAADIIKIAMIKVYKKLKENNFKSRLILQVHDELLIEAHKDEIDEVRELLVNEMENAVTLSVPLNVEANIGASWYEAK